MILWLTGSSFFLLVREIILPHIGEYRNNIATMASETLGLPVTINALAGSWTGRYPELHMNGVSIHDQNGQPVFTLEQITATLAWSSLLHFEPHFKRIELKGPELALSRQKDGTLVVAGIPVQHGGGNSTFLDWLLKQQQIIIRDAALTWTDETRDASTLRLNHVQLRLDKHFSFHAFGLQAQPPEALASTLDIRGELRQLDLDHPDHSIGRFYIALDHADLGGWQPWVDYPFPLEGKGGIHAWIDLDGKTATNFTADVSLSNVITRLGDDLPALQLSQLSGRLEAIHTETGNTLTTKHMTLSTADGVTIPPTDFSLKLALNSDRQLAGGSILSNILDIRMLSRLAAHLPLEDGVRKHLAAFNPQGQIHALHLDWQGPASAPDHWNLNARFNDIGLVAREQIPGLGGLSGEIEGNNITGRFHLAGESMHIDLPAVFEQSRLAFASLRADGGWVNQNDQLEIRLDSATFENPDATGSAEGRYWPSSQNAGRIDLQAKLTRAEGTAVWRYLPRVVNQSTYDWVRHAIRRAKVPSTTLNLRGNLDDFPFRHGEGEFLVSIQVVDGLLDYASGWPVIEKLNGEVRFEGPGMRIQSKNARILGVELHDTLAEIPDLDTGTNPVMTITGRASGQTAAFLDFIMKSPVSSHINHMTEPMRAQGNSQLALKLVMPLDDPEATRIQGTYQFNNNQLWLTDSLPPLEKATGLLSFTENQLSLSDGKALLLEGPVHISGKTTAPGTIQFTATGSLPVSGLHDYLPQPVLSRLKGQTPWESHIDLSPEKMVVHVNTQLDGLESSLPPPFNKSLTEHWPLTVSVSYPDKDGKLQLTGSLAERLMLNLIHTPGQTTESLYGGIGIFQSAPVSARGITLAARLDKLNLDAWRQLTQNPNHAPAPSRSTTIPLTAINLQADTLQLLDQEWNQVRLNAQATATGWEAALESKQAQGHLSWQNIKNGALTAQFSRLAIQRTATASSPDADINHSPQTSASDSLPDINLQAEQFMLNDLNLGTLKLKANNHNAVWSLENFSLSNPETTLTGSGTWQTGKTQHTQLQLKLDTSNIGKLMTRLGHPDTVQGGHAQLNGTLAWAGTPTELDYPSLSGKLTVDARNGQFKQLEPGMGRLLGVLSLQALPRRISLDFRDVFSNGFVFDNIAADIGIMHGTMKTDRLQINGPAARVTMHGTADLKAETQDLIVTVQPTLSESIAIGAAAGLVNPVAGVVTYIAQKALSDPIERLFSFNYAITGSWDDPQVTKLGSKAENLMPNVPIPFITPDKSVQSAPQQNMP